VVELVETAVFVDWMEQLADPRARDRISIRLRRLAMGNPGDVRPIGDGLSELRIDYGPGYRVYYIRRGRQLIVVLNGGTKQTQARDIQEARHHAALI
jgi:putative addiction module killer protein